MTNRMRRAPIVLAVVLTGCNAADDGRKTAVLAATHTLEDSGLLDSLAVAFRTEHPELRLRITVSGTGEALEHARRGLADVVVTHAPEAERRLLDEGAVLDRHELMYNSFIIAGPAADPAGIGGMTDSAAALARISEMGARFVSRDDSSGTHMRELGLWRDAGAQPPAGGDYIRAGVGMADALRIADERRAYLLTDSATFVVLRDHLSLVPLVYGDPRLRNTYSVMRVTAARDSAAARALADWLLGDQAADVIHRFGGGGSRMFVPLRTRADTSSAGPHDSVAALPSRQMLLSA